MKNKINSVIAVCVLVFIAMACNASFTTANISSLNFGKNNTAEPATTTFNQGEKIYAVVNVSGANRLYVVKFKVESASGSGQPLTKQTEIPGSGNAYLEITNIAAGEYKTEAVLVDESGKEVDKKTGTFSVKGGSTTTEKPKDSETEETEK